MGTKLTLHEARMRAFETQKEIQEKYDDAVAEEAAFYDAMNTPEEKDAPQETLQLEKRQCNCEKCSRLCYLSYPGAWTDIRSLKRAYEQVSSVYNIDTFYLTLTPKWAYDGTVIFHPFHYTIAIPYLHLLRGGRCIYCTEKGCVFPLDIRPDECAYAHHDIGEDDSATMRAYEEKITVGFTDAEVKEIESVTHINYDLMQKCDVYVRNIYLRNLTLDNVESLAWIKRRYKTLRMRMRAYRLLDLTKYIVTKLLGVL